MLWNVGVRAITSEDVTDIEPVAVAVNGRILEYRVLPTEAPLAIAELYGENAIRLGFDRLSGLFESLRFRNLGHMLAVGYDSMAIDYLERVAPEDFEILNRGRGLCLEIIHDDPDPPWVVSGRIGGVSIADFDSNGYLKAQRVRRRSGLVVFTLLGAIGFLAWQWATDNPNWVTQNLFLRRGAAWDVFLGVAFAVVGGVVSYYMVHIAGSGRTFLPGRRGDAEDDHTNGLRLWDQRVPFALRARPDVSQRAFFERTASRRAPRSESSTS